MLSPSNPQTLSSARRFPLLKDRMRRIFPRQESFDSGASQRTIIAHPNNVVYSDEKQTIDPDTPLEGSDGADNRSMLPEKSSGLLSVSELSKDDNATTKTSFRSASPFRGLPEYRIDPFKITINDILDGIQVRGQMRSQDGDKEVVPLDTASMTGDPTTPPESGDEGLKREGRKQSKERRPELQVSIPQSKLRGPATSTLRAEDKRTKQPSGASAVSPASTTTSTTLPSNKQFPGVSPLSVVNPQPRRPLSTQSLEGRTVPDQTTDTTVASMSKGLENASQHDRGVRVLHSPTSISTNAHTNTNTNTSGTQTRMVSAKADLDRRVIQAKEGRLVQGQEDDCATVPDSVDGRTQPPVAESLRTTAAFVSAATTSASAYLPTTTSTTTTTTTTTTATVTASPPPPPVRPGLHSKHSNTSIVTVSSTRSTRTLDRNKPLPPEPDHANRIARSPSRSSTLTARQRIMPLPLGSNGDFTNAPGVSRVKSKGSASLRSRYTPKDLDALDEAFQQPLPVKHQTTSSYSSNSTPTLSQVTLALEHQLGTIQEALPARTVASPSSSDPLQISRGPMRMEPSRRAPQPPGRPSSPPHYTQDYRRRIMRRAASSNHVITQMRVAETIPHRRASTTASTAPSSKAMRILGEKSGAKTPVRMERKNSMDSNWSSSDSPQMYTSATSPDLEEEEEEVESLTPESELSSIPDAHFEEIRKRLELLSPKDDPSRTFHAFHQKNAPRSTEKLTQYRDHSAKAGNEHGPPSHKPAEIRIPEHIAELEGNQIPSPVELEDTQRMAPVELGPPSPLPMPMITAPVTLPPPMPPPPPPPPPAVSSTAGDTRLLERRGRADELSPHSAATSVKSRSFHSNRSMKARSLASLAMSEIPDLYAAIPSPENVLRPSMTAEEVEHLMFADAAERVLLRILQSLDNLEDLFAAAEVSRGFYRTFKRHELPLIKNALWCMSPAAWELREMSVPFAELEHGASDYEPSMYLQHYKRDIVTMVPLKGMILDHCKSFLRPETISGLSGETDRSPFIDDAFWRVWTFCRIFGCGKGREDDIVGQMDWLRGGVLAIQQSTDTNTLSLSDGIVMNSVLFNPPAGFARGNHRGLTAEELYDMNEIWICLGVLVRGFHGRRKEAREYGIFDGTHIAPGDVEKENAALGIPPSLPRSITGR